MCIRDSPNGHVETFEYYFRWNWENYAQTSIRMDYGRNDVSYLDDVYICLLYTSVSPHLCAEMMNYMKYDAGNMGNPDVETGRAVFDRWINTCDFPV